MLKARGVFAILSAFAAAVAAGVLGLGVSQLGAAPEGEREISFYHIHTKETLTVVYKRGGKYIPEAMDKIDWLMRDWRQNQAIKMDPETIDILWEMHTELGSKEPMHVICGYRSGSTNAMLRRTVGGQAKNSNHITGKAIDVYFPDVPPKFVRYAGLVRERGGVGYYPTSAMPFSHIDNGRVRHWPKMGKDELAMLFPGGKSKHVSSGGALRPGDYERAKARNAALFTQVAAYNDLRTGAKPPVLVAAADLPAPAAPKLEAKLKPAKPAVVVASLGTAPVVAPKVPAAAPEPKLVSVPRLVERPSRFTRPSEKDRAGMNKLVLASLEPSALPAPRLVAQPALAVRPKKSVVPAAEQALPPAGTPEGSYDPEAENEANAGQSGLGGNWAQAAAFDEDHPEELSYRPFPLGPMLTATASPDDPALTELVHPDLARTFEVLDDDGAVQPMLLRPRQQVAQLLWAQQFRGDAVRLSDMGANAGQVPAGLAKRAVRTTLR